MKFALDEVESSHPSENWFRDWCDASKATAKEALASVVEGHMRPRPGRYCERCGYADLCRSAKGQDTDPEAWSSTS